MEAAELLRHKFDNTLSYTLKTSEKFEGSSLTDELIPLHGAYAATYSTLGDFQFCTYEISWGRIWYQNRTANSFKMAMGYKNSLPFLKGGRIYLVSKHLVMLPQTFEDELPNTNRANYEVPPRIVYSLCIRKEALFSGQMNINVPLPTDKLVMVIDTKLLHADYKLFYNFFTKEVIQPLQEAGVDLIFTSDIHKYCWNPYIIKESFPTMSAMRSHTEQLTKSVINGITI